MMFFQGTETETPFAGTTATTRGRDMRWKSEGDEHTTGAASSKEAAAVACLTLSAWSSLGANIL